MITIDTKYWTVEKCWEVMKKSMAWLICGQVEAVLGHHCMRLGEELCGNLEGMEATTWSVDGDCFASLTNYWRNHGFLALCKVDFCFRWWHLFSLQEQTQNCFYVKQARVFVLEGSSLPKWVSVRDKTERKGLISLLDTNKFLNNQWQFYWREHFIIKLLVHHSNWKLLAQNNITQLHGILIERSLIQIYGEILVNFTFIN